ncbi:MAG: T9SS type A sorting domain-containing protein [Chitinophagales bacterium]|nr:T9SS type A sorting domain-containing protein [Chitinophagales bacterium]
MDLKPLFTNKWKHIHKLLLMLLFSVAGSGLLLAQTVPPVCGPGANWVQTCAAGTDIFSTSALVGLDLHPYDGFCFREFNLVLNPSTGTTDQILRSAPKDAISNAAILPPGPDCPTPTLDGVLDVIETEMVSLDITDGSFRLRAGTGVGLGLPATLGAIIELPNNDSCACSYFDVFFEVLTPCGPLYNHTPLRVTSIIKKVPPQSTYFHPVGLCIDLYPTPLGTPSWPVAQLVDALHLAQLPVEFGCTDPAASNYNPSATVDDGSCCYPVFGPGPGWFGDALAGPPGFDELLTGANICINLNPSNCQPFPADLELNLIGPTGVSRVPQPTAGVIQTEMVSMSLTGTDPGFPVQLRAGNDASVPLPPSNGVVQQTSPPDPFVAESFFDVFFEVEIGSPSGGPPILGYNHQPVQLGAVIDRLPPENPLQGAPGQCIQIFDQPPGAPTAILIGNLVKTIHFPKIVPGCTDPTALNFNPSATFDDGSCIFGGILCGPPNNPATIKIFDNKATLTWEPLFGATSYEITGKPCTGGPSSIVTITLPGTACEYLATGLLPNTCYEWVIKVNGCPAFGCGTSAASTLATFLTAPLCKAPNPLSTTNITTTTAKLNWNNDGNCSSYKIYGRPVGTVPVTTITQPGTASMLTATGLSSGTTYEWSAQCICNSGEASPLATKNTFTTLGPTDKNAKPLSFGDNLAISVYPNPAKDKVNIGWYGVNGSTVDIIIYGIDGKAIQRHESLTGANLEIATSDIPKGVYTVVVRSGDSIKVEKLIIAN